MKRPLATIVLGLVAAGGGAFSGPPPEPSPWWPLPADLKSDLVLRLRLELEYRRAGGPRHDIVDRILMDGRTGDSRWSYWATIACVDGRTACAPLLPVLRSILDRHLTEDDRKYTEHGVALVAHHAYLEGLPASVRQEAYRRLIAGEHVDDPELKWLDPDSTALMALREGVDDLIPLIRDELDDRLRANRSSIGTEMRVREAAISPAPGSALLALVREGVKFDVELGLRPSDTGKTGALPRIDETPLHLARRAMEALRAINRSGAVKPLKELLELYRPVEERREREEKSNSLTGQWLRAVPRPELPPGQRPLVGRLSRELVETTGDLGDRDFERTTFKNRLGLPILWDKVKQVETELVRQKKLSSDQMVTGSNL